MRLISVACKCNNRIHIKVLIHIKGSLIQWQFSFYHFKSQTTSKCICVQQMQFVSLVNQLYGTSGRETGHPPGELHGHRSETARVRRTESQGTRLGLWVQWRPPGQRSAPLVSQSQEISHITPSFRDWGYNLFLFCMK